MVTQFFFYFWLCLSKAKGYLRGENDLYPGRLEEIILVTTSIDVIERINIQSGEISRKYLQ